MKERPNYVETYILWGHEENKMSGHPLNSWATAVWIRSVNHLDVVELILKKRVLSLFDEDCNNLGEYLQPRRMCVVLTQSRCHILLFSMQVLCSQFWKEVIEDFALNSPLASFTPSFVHGSRVHTRASWKENLWHLQVRAEAQDSSAYLWRWCCFLESQTVQDSDRALPLDVAPGRSHENVARCFSRRRCNKLTFKFQSTW